MGIFDFVCLYKMAIFTQRDNWGVMSSREDELSKSSQELDRKLTAQCALLSQDLQEVHETLNTSAAKGPKSTDSKHALRQIYKQKEKLLQSQIQLLKKRKLTTLTASTQLHVVKERLSTLVSQLQETRDYMKAKRTSIVDDVRNAEKLKEEQEQMENVLETRLREEEQKANSASPSAVAAQMDQQYALYLAHYKSTLQAFLPFVHKQFPPPRDVEPPRSTTGRTKSSSNNSSRLRLAGGNQYMALSSLLEELMNKSLDSPGDPYITLNPERHYQPYIELLQRSGITQRHPKNDKLLKITPFHL